MHHELETLPDPAAVAAAGATFVAELARDAVAADGVFRFAVSGGHTPWAMFAELAQQQVPWDSVVIYQVDERVAPPDDPDRNLAHLRQALGQAPAQVWAMPVNESDLEAAAAEYAASLPRGVRPRPPGSWPRRAYRVPRPRRSGPGRRPIAWSPSPSPTRAG